MDIAWYVKKYKNINVQNGMYFVSYDKYSTIGCYILKYALQLNRKI